MLETPKGTEIEYDLFNRMVKYTKGTDVYTYTYNGDGQRMSKTVNGVTTYFAWDGMDMILERVDYFNNTGYYYGPDGVEFQQYSDGMHLAAAYVKNALGDVVGTYDVMSGVTLYREYCYDAYGNAVEEYDNTNAIPPSENPFRYRGEYYDTETGFYYLRNRYYDPKAGRFITEDPIRDGTNWYTYCAGNPVMFRDSSGMTYVSIRKVMTTYGTLYWESGVTYVGFKNPRGVTYYAQSFYSGDKYGTYVDNNDTMRVSSNILPSLSGDRNLDGMLYAALGERGYQESGVNYTKYGEWFGNNGSEWCATFVSWAASTADIMGSTVPKFQSCYDGINFYKEQGRFHLSTSDYEPKAGDLFFVSSADNPNGGAHTGIVLAYDGEYIYTLEGNHNNQVQVVARYAIGVYGYGSNGGRSAGIVPYKVDDYVI